VQADCNHWHPRVTQLASYETTRGIMDAGAIPAASTFSEHTSSNDTSRQLTSKADAAKGVATMRNGMDSRQRATASGSRRPPRATKSATSGSVVDPDLAAIMDAWPNLPEVVRAGIVAIVRAAAGT
jgi:hypothetical protein